MGLITAGEDTIAPQSITGVSEWRSAGNIVHPIIGRPSPDVTLRPAVMRAGKMTLGFTGPAAEADSNTAVGLLAAGSVFALSNDARTSFDMWFVVAENGRIVRELNLTRTAWTVAVDYQEVAGQ